MKTRERRTWARGACSAASGLVRRPSQSGRADVFNYIEMFYNPKRRHGTAGDTSPVEFERRHSQRLTGV